MRKISLDIKIGNILYNFPDLTHLEIYDVTLPGLASWLQVTSSLFRTLPHDADTSTAIDIRLDTIKLRETRINKRDADESPIEYFKGRREQ